MTAQADTSTRWDEVCAYDDLMPERGACALVRDIQVAVSRTFDGELYALSNHDPFSGAYVPPRGILGTRQGVPTVASPMYKQVFRPAYRTIPGRFRSGDARLRRPRVPWRGRRPGEGGRTLTCFLIPGRGARPVPAVPVAGAAVRGSRGRPAPCLPARSSGRPRTSATEHARGCRP